MKDALAAKDFYSAHQIYLAIAQRHCRNKRYEDAKQILKEGCLELATHQEARSSADLARRYINTLSLGRLPLIDTDAVTIHAVLTAVGKSGEGAEEALKVLSDTILKEHSSLLLVVFHALVQSGAHKEAGMILLKAEDVNEEWQLLGSVVSDPHVVLSLVLAGLRARNFAAISQFLATIISKKFPDAPIMEPGSGGDNDLPDFVRVIDNGELTGDTDTMARCVNLCQLLFVTFQRRLLPSPSVLTKLLQNYAGLLAKLRFKEEDVKALEHLFLIQQQSESGASGGTTARPDVLANLFQTMMSQGAAGGGGFPKRR